MKLRLALAALLISSSAYAADIPRPDARMTPGVVASTDEQVVCKPNYSRTVRKTSPWLKQTVYRWYGIDPAKTSNYGIDHRVPLSLGGADVAKNLWPLDLEHKRGMKDKLEVRLHAYVCHKHTMTLEQAQEVFLGDWVVGYRRYFGAR